MSASGMNRPVIFIAADQRECQAWTSKWSDLQPLPLAVHYAHRGVWNNNQVIAIANGAGPAQATAAVYAIRHLTPKAIVSIGTCGALDPSLQIGDIFTPTEIRTKGPTYAVQTFTGPVSIKGPMISLSRIAATASEKAALRRTGALAVEMESGGVADASHLLGVPFYCVRAVSDLADEDFANDFNKILMPDGRFNIPALLLSALARPLTRIPELARLARRSALASKNMGDFLALCSF